MRRSIATLLAASALSSTTSTERRRAPWGGSRRPARSRANSVPARSVGRRTSNSAPRPGPSLLAPREREPDAQAAFGAVDGALALREEIEHVVQHGGGDPHAVVAHPDHRVVG